MIPDAAASSSATELSAAFATAVLRLDRVTARRVLVEAAAHLPAMQRIEQILVPALERIGADWEGGSVALSEVYMSGRVCEELIDELLLETACVRKSQPIMAVTVLEDWHMLGKRMVYASLRAAGFSLADYGRSDVAQLARRCATDGIELVLISTLMLSSALRVREVRRALRAAGCAAKIIVGGAPFRLDDQLWQEVGADAMARTATELPAMIDRLWKEHGSCMQS